MAKKINPIVIIGIIFLALFLYNNSQTYSTFCLAVESHATNTATGECRGFSNSCIPDGWVLVENCVQNVSSVSFIELLPESNLTINKEVDFACTALFNNISNIRIYYSKDANNISSSLAALTLSNSSIASIKKTADLSDGNYYWQCAIESNHQEFKSDVKFFTVSKSASPKKIDCWHISPTYTCEQKSLDLEYCPNDYYTNNVSCQAKLKEITITEEPTFIDKYGISFFVIVLLCSVILYIILASRRKK